MGIHSILLCTQTFLPYFLMHPSTKGALWSTTLIFSQECNKWKDTLKKQRNLLVMVSTRQKLQLWKKLKRQRKRSCEKLKKLTLNRLSERRAIVYNKHEVTIISEWFIGMCIFRKSYFVHL